MIGPWWDVFVKSDPISHLHASANTQSYFYEKRRQPTKLKDIFEIAWAYTVQNFMRRIRNNWDSAAHLFPNKVFLPPQSGLNPGSYE